MYLVLKPQQREITLIIYNCSYFPLILIIWKKNYLQQNFWNALKIFTNGSLTNNLTKCSYESLLDTNKCSKTLSRKLSKNCFLVWIFNLFTQKILFSLNRIRGNISYKGYKCTTHLSVLKTKWLNLQANIKQIWSTKIDHCL